MPDITLITMADATTTSAADAARNLYNPTAADSFEVINGRLDNANRQSGWDIRAPHVRDRSLVDGSMVGQTGNLDFSEDVFPDTNGDAGAYIPIAGAGIRFYLPLAPTLLVVTWQVVAAADNAAASQNVEMRFWFDANRQDNQFRVVPQTIFSGTTRMIYRDRIWSGTWASVNAAAGWHSAGVRVFVGRQGSNNSAVLARFRVRNIKHFWLR